jgi:hypothetical protein
MRAGLLSVIAITCLALGMVVPVASAAATSRAAAPAASTVSAVMTPAGSVSFPGLSCNYGTDGDITGWGGCFGTGTWTLHVGCNFSPVVLTQRRVQSRTYTNAALYCWQGVNDVWLTSP